MGFSGLAVGMVRTAAAVLSLLFCLLTVFSARADAPGVVVSVKPIHSLVAGVMRGAGSPYLLLPGAASPHSYSLRPSDARALHAAAIVFWVGEPLEAFLIKPLASLSARTRVVGLLEEGSIHTLEAREGGAWDTHDHEEDHAGHKEEHTDHEEEHSDGHIWLDPRNAVAIVEIAAKALTDMDPGNASIYRGNADALVARITALEKEFRAAFAPVRRVPYVVFHDAYQYLERRFGLNAIGSVAVHTGRAPGARRLHELRGKIVELHARCVFSEPQFKPRLVQTVVEGTGAAVGILDPMGADLPPGEEAYFELMRRIAGALTSCLSRGA